MTKKLFLTVIFSLTFCAFIKAQLVTTTPNYPEPQKSVTIFFDASLGNAALKDYAGDIYAHTGVITTASTSGSDWKYVKTNWGQNTDQTKLTRLTANTYKLELSPSIMNYYAAPQTETILKMAFVFRNEDGTKVAKNTDGTDIFIDVYADAQGISISEPDTTKIYSQNATLSVNAVALFATQMSVYLNDELIKTENTNKITTNFTATKQGTNLLKITATDGTTNVEKTCSFFVRTETQIAELPNINLIEGINYIDNNTVTLVLYAPKKDFIFVNGSFSDWKLSEANQMYKTPDGKTFWLTINNLEPQKEYAFQYIIDGQIYVADAYTDKILDPWNDSFIDNQTYPNLIKYPTGKATGILSVFQTAQTDYQWTTTNFQKAEAQNLVVYELHIRDFIGKHNYSTLIDTINYLKNLGVNAIELMPISEFEGNSSWGYNPSFYFAADKYYGTKNDLKQFIDICHKNNIAVILDIVLNHSFGQSPLVQMYFDPQAGQYGQTSADNPWYNATSPNTSYSWGYDFNHQSPYTKKFVSRVVKYWIQEYKFDGYRFDFTKGFTNTIGDGWAYDASRIKILKDIADTIWKADDKAYIILEHLTDNSEEKVLAEYGFLLWGNINHAYNEATMGYADSDFSWISYKKREWNTPNLVGYMESHDEERLMFKNLKYGATYQNYNIKDTATALKRIELAAAFFFTIPGPKMIWQFGELGYEITIDEPCRVCDKPILWQYYNNENRKRLYNVFSELIHLKTNNEAFNSQTFSLYTNSAIKHIIIEHSSMDVVVIGNFDTKAVEYKPKFTKQVTWYDYFSGDEITNIDTLLLLQAGEYHIFTTKKLETPKLPSPPVATNLYISGQPINSQTLTANYTYFDVNNDTENSSTFQWYRADSELGDNKVAITGATQQNYTLTSSDIKKYISFEVTPVANSTELKNGNTSQSKAVGPVTESSGTEIRIDPNPSYDFIKCANIGAYTNILIKDIFGKNIVEYSTNNQNEYVINTFEYSAGVYVVKFYNEKEYKTKILIILK